MTMSSRIECGKVDVLLHLVRSLLAFPLPTVLADFALLPRIDDPLTRRATAPLERHRRAERAADCGGGAVDFRNNHVRRWKGNEDAKKPVNTFLRKRTP